MTSTQRFIANSANQFAGAILTASSVKPIADAVLSLPRARSGSARATLSGLYTGQEEAFYEVEITDTTVSTPLISAPVFTGAGTGSISGIAYTGSAQSFTVKLADLGQILTAAGTDIEGASLVARNPGAAGNTIRLHVDLSGLTYADTNYSLLKPLVAGASAEGAEYDWDTKIMGADGQVPANAHRLVFGEDASIVYTQYKQYQDGKWLYSFEPAIAREIPVSTRIRFVSGARVVTISDGTLTEAYPGIVTLYDLLSAIQASSALVKATGVIANDRAPGGMASRDLLTRTDAHCLAPTSQGSEYASGALQSYTAQAAAPTELVEIRCWANSPKDSPNAGVGRELWQVKGSVSGIVSTAYKTGDLFAGSDFGFRIPVKTPDGFGVQRGRFSITGINYTGRGVGVENPPICVASMALGPDAFDQQLTLVYKKRPSGECACKDMAAPDLSSRFCLTGTTTGGTDMAYTPATVTRLTALYDWGADMTLANTYYIDGKPCPEFWLEDLRAAIAEFERTLAAVEGNATAEANWDTVITEFQTQTEAALGAKAVENDVISGAANIDAGDFVSYSASANALTLISPFQSIYADGYALTSGVGGGSIDWQPCGRGILDMRYQTRLDWVLISAGISPLGKSDASTVAGDGCWRDSDATHWWEITGQNGAYAPAFTNEPYFSSRDAGEGYFSTHEFAFQINVKCEASLLEGDTLQLSIGDAGWPSTYQVGDTLYLPIIAAQDLYLAGGKDGDNIQTWHVDGSVTGAFPPYLLDLDAPAPYSGNGLAMQITPGGIPFEAGDLYKFTVEGGHYRWRKDSGAWSATQPVGGASAPIDSGLSLLFQTGASPSFAAGDLYKFRALQPCALSNAINPDPESWRWSGSGATLTANLGSSQLIDACSLSFHDLPDTAVVTLQGGADGVVWDWSESIPWRAGVMAALFTEKTATWLKLTIINAFDASIGWAWAGQAVSTEFHAECMLSRDYRIERGAGLNPSAVWLGQAMSGTIEWQVLRDPDMLKIMPMLDSLKQNDDQPMILIPQSTRPEEAWPVRVDVDMIDAAEDGGYQSNTGNERRYTMKLNLKGVVA